MCYSALVKRDLNYLHRKYGATVIREQVDDYLRAAAVNPKLFPPLEERIFPGTYAPVIFKRAGASVIGLQRYGAYPPALIKEPSHYTTFNARLDNLTSSFWAEAFGKHHGFVVLQAFYEWVAVKDLLAAGAVTLDQVKADFAKQAEDRRKKIEAAGKKSKPTPTEVKDPRLRKIVIEFKPSDEQDLIVPAIFSMRTMDDGRIDAGFAVVTHDPPPEIAEAGHDRCPVVLPMEALPQWLQPEGKTASELQALLTGSRRVMFTHALPEAA